MAADMAVKGWGIPDLARASGLTYKTAARFINGEVQTAKTAARLAQALGFSVRRYFSHVEAVA